jgi:hypothetical protein
MEPFQYALCAIFLITGTIYIISLKGQDWQMSMGEYFAQPFIQV